MRLIMGIVLGFTLGVMTTGVATGVACIDFEELEKDQWTVIGRRGGELCVVHSVSEEKGHIYCW